MMRSALALLFSMTAVGCLFLAMQTEFLGVLQIMMMATEMSIMAIFMVMFMPPLSPSPLRCCPTGAPQRSRWWTRKRRHGRWAWNCWDAQ